MKILMLTSEFAPFRGGIGTYALELARAATALGHDVTVAAPSYNAEQGADDARLPFRVRRFPGGVNRAKDILAKIRWTIALSRRESFDVVHAIDWPFFIPLAMSGYRRTARCLLTFHGTEINMMKRPSRRIILPAIRFWNGWATCIANSRFTGTHLLQSFPALSPDRVRSIPLGVRQPDDVAVIERIPARTALGIDDDDVMMVSLGRVVRRKGLHVTLAALDLLDPALKSRLVWYVVGPENDGDYARGIKDGAAAFGLRAVFTGGIPANDVERALSAADLFCLPAIWGGDGEFEGFGLVYLEAALRGVPSIGTALGGIPDAVIDGVTGKLVTPDDPGALADAIKSLALDSDLRRVMATQARDHARRQTWEKVAEETYR